MKKIIKNLPEDLRPYEKCEKMGPAGLGDAELIAVILRTGCVGKQSVELAAEIMAMCGAEGVCGIAGLSYKELTDIKGVGRVKAVQIQCIGELAKRIARKHTGKKLVFREPCVIAEYYMEEYRLKAREELKVIMLNSKSVYMGEVNVSVGTVNASHASSREIFLEALKYKAVNIVLLHNHPSGDATPSRQDIESTRVIKQAGDIIGIRLLDHIVIGNHEYVSFSEKGIIF